jgi:two-component system, OmpR family, alkaline phosphatase synthesis response regulator PhoP
MARILVAEDEPGIAFSLKADLTSEGYEITVAVTGAEALRLGAQERFDLILLDVMLPGTDGFEICRTLRRSGVRTPIIMLTAKVQEAEKVMGLELGADDYITKPFSPRELRARVKAALRRSAADTPDVFRFADVEVDFTRGEVRRAGRPVELSALEFRLLTTFVKQHGRLLTREQLLDAVWGHGTAIHDRVVDNHIVSLRRKLEPNPAEPRFLVNVRGLGYRFDA